MGRDHLGVHDVLTDWLGLIVTLSLLFIGTAGFTALVLRLTGD